MSTRESTSLRVLVECRPLILQCVLADLLSNVHGITLAAPGTEPVDVVITSSREAVRQFDGLTNEPVPTRIRIIIDREQNTLYVRRTTQESVGIEILPGEIPALLNVLNREVSKLRLLLMDGRSA